MNKDIHKKLATYAQYPQAYPQYSYKFCSFFQTFPTLSTASLCGLARTCE